MQPVENIETSDVHPVQKIQPITPIRTLFVTRLLPEFSAIADEWPTVREVAARLKVSTATVYNLIERGELTHTRVSNAVRVSEAALMSYLRRE